MRAQDARQQPQKMGFSSEAALCILRKRTSRSNTSNLSPSSWIPNKTRISTDSKHTSTDDWSSLRADRLYPFCRESHVKLKATCKSEICTSSGNAEPGHAREQDKGSSGHISGQESEDGTIAPTRS